MRIGELRAADGPGWRFDLQASDTHHLFFEHPDDPLPPLEVLDAPLVGSLLFWMSQPVDQVRVRGPVSRTLLRNLEELQLVWARWDPARYRAVEIAADSVLDDVPTGEGAVAAFSGGVDASFTVLRHALHPGAHSFSLREVALIQGFDIPTGQDAAFRRARERGERLLQGTGLPIASVRTNLKEELPQRWEHSFGLCVAAALLTFQDRRRVGLLGSSEPYDAMVMPWGSTPVQDWMASTGSIEIRHDGAGFSRSEKVQALASWPEACANLRVCWAGEAHDRNCGRCEKCIRTMLNFLAVGQPVPSCFDRSPQHRDIRRLRVMSEAIAAEFESILEAANANGVDAPWTRTLKRRMRPARLEVRLRQSAAYVAASRAKRRLRTVG